MRQGDKWFLKSLKCIKYDLQEGLLKLYPIYFIGFVMTAAFAVGASKQLGMVVEKPGVMELSVKMFEGMPVYKYVKGGPGLEIPMTYLTFGLAVCFLASYYTKREWNLRGSIFITRYRSKAVWWISKCILCSFQVIIFYAATFIILWITAGIGGNWSFKVRAEISAVCRGQLLITESLKILLYIYVLGICICIALNQMITTLQLVFSPAVGYVLAIVMIIAAACTDKIYILGNDLMLLRTEICNEMGMTLGSGAFMAFIYWIVFVGLGWVIVRKKDVLS